MGDISRFSLAVNNGTWPTHDYDYIRSNNGYRPCSIVQPDCADPWSRSEGTCHAAGCARPDNTGIVRFPFCKRRKIRRATYSFAESSAEIREGSLPAKNIGPPAKQTRFKSESLDAFFPSGPQFFQTGRFAAESIFCREGRNNNTSSV
jgi:hypothetical protein